MLNGFKLRKISWKLTFIYAFIFSVVLVVLNAGTLVAVRYYLIRQAETQVIDSSQITMNSVSSSEERFDLFDPELLRQAQAISEIDIKITDIHGKTLLSSGKFSIGFENTAADIGRLTVLESNDKHLVIDRAYILHQGKKVGILQVVYNMRKEYDFIKLLFILMLLADILGIVLSFLSGLFVSKQMLKPIDKMTKTARNITINDLENRIDVGSSDDELSRLAMTFNDMIGRLQESFEKQNRFVSDASHELRTPITIIKGYADLIEEWAKDDPQILAESVVAIRKEINGMTRLIKELLFLARGDSGKLHLQKEKIDLSALVEDVAEESRMIAPERQFKSNVRDKVELYADKRLIKQMLRALVDNSVKYTKEDGIIEFGAASLQNGVTISVTDNGIGIPKDDVPHLFDRFYRVDKARAKEKGGSGLGLSIVKWIVEIHGGAVKIESTKNIGTTVVVLFPNDF